MNRYADLKDAHIPTLSNAHSYKVSQFHKTLKATFGKSLATLQVQFLGLFFFFLNIKFKKLIKNIIFSQLV